MSEQKSWKLVNFCEFDKYATKSYCAIHGVDESLNLGDITKVDENEIENFNMMCFASPCQDFSLSGAQKGSMWRCKDCGEEYNPLTVHYLERNLCPKCKSDNLDKTRSSLIVEGLRIIKSKKPNWAIYENVKNLVGNQFKETFNMFIDELNEYGYNTHYKVLNSKDFGVPQNRERVFLVIIKKDLDNGKFKFPEPFDNGIRLKDVLEDDVDNKFYVDSSKTKKIIEDMIRNKKLNKLVDFKKTTGIFSKQCNCFDKYSDVANTLLARDYKGFGNQGMNGVLELIGDNFKIRRLTPKECFRLQGFSDESYEKAKSVNSNTQLFKQAGNSITVDVLYYIYVELYTAMPYLFDDLKLSSFFSGIGAFEIALDKLYEGINSGNFTNPQVE